MTGFGPALRDLLTRRLELVARLSQVTAAKHKLQQARAGAEIEIQRCEMAAISGPDDEVARDLLRARQHAEESARGEERCEAEIADLELSLAETDRQIEAAARL
jgi:hypothetical protein